MKSTERLNLKELAKRLDEQYGKAATDEEREDIASLLLMLIEQGVTPTD